MKSVARLFSCIFLAAVCLLAACNAQAGPEISTPTARVPLRSA